MHRSSVLFNPGGQIALSDIQETLLTNVEHFYLRVPSCRTLSDRSPVALHVQPPRSMHAHRGLHIGGMRASSAVMLVSGYPLARVFVTDVSRSAVLQ